LSKIVENKFTDFPEIIENRFTDYHINNSRQVLLTIHDRCYLSRRSLEKSRKKRRELIGRGRTRSARRSLKGAQHEKFGSAASASALWNEVDGQSNSSATSKAAPPCEASHNVQPAARPRLCSRLRSQLYSQIQQ
jgi:hypothetical protein